MILLFEHGNERFGPWPEAIFADHFGTKHRPAIIVHF